MRPFEDVYAWHVKCKQEIGEKPVTFVTCIDTRDIESYLKMFRFLQNSLKTNLLAGGTANLTVKGVDLILEEVVELIETILTQRKPGVIARELVDVIYVILGYAISSGIDLRPIWDYVQFANMQKAGGPKRSDGKQLKPIAWVDPQPAIDELITSQLSLFELCGDSDELY